METAEPTIDVERVRSETPGCDEVVHLNNAGSSLPTHATVDRITRHLALEEGLGGYEAEALVHEELDGVPAAVAKLIGAGDSEIALVDSATRAWAMAFESIEFERGQRILASEAEYASNFIAFLQARDRYGVTVETIPSTDEGIVCLDRLAEMLDDSVALVAVTHVPTDSGLINPVAEIGAVVLEASSALYLVDACQSVGQLPVSVEEIGCDFLSATGRKFLRGPRGTGFLYASARTTGYLKPRTADLSSAEWVDATSYRLRTDARRFAYWEANLAAQLGLGEAVRYAVDLGMDLIHKRIVQLAEHLRERLAKVPGIQLRDDDGPRGGIVTFTSHLMPAHSVCDALRSRGINTWPVTRAASVLNMDRRGVAEVVRASVHYYNTEEEIEWLVGCLRAIGATR